MTAEAPRPYGVALTVNALGGAMKIVWYLLAILLGGLSVAGFQHIAHYPDVPTRVGNIVITLLLLVGAWRCLRRANRLSEANKGKMQKQGPGA